MTLPIQFSCNKKVKQALVILLMVDLVFVLLHLLFRFGIIEGDIRLRIDTDRGYAEYFQYAKEVVIILLLVWLAIRKRAIVFIAWAVFFLYILLDDSFRIHEDLGRYLSELWHFQPAFNLEAKDLGELLVMAFFGFSFLISIAISHFKSRKTVRVVSRQILILFVILVFCGVVLDMAHIASPIGNGVLGLAEDAGEMLVMSIILCFLVDQHVSEDRKELYSAHKKEG